MAERVVTISGMHPTFERLQRVNSFSGGSRRYTATNCILLSLHRVLRRQSLESNLVYNFTNMRAMSYRSGFFTCSSRVNIWEPAAYFAVSFLSAVFGLGLPSCLILTVMSNSTALNTLLLEVMTTSRNERIFIHDFSDLTFQIIFDAWWASIKVDSKLPIAWNDSRHAPSWQFYLHCWIEKTGSRGIICIICHRVLCNPSEYGNSSLGKHLLGKAHIAKLN